MQLELFKTRNPFQGRQESDCAIRTPLVSSTERQRQADTSEFQVSQGTQLGPVFKGWEANRSISTSLSVCVYQFNKHWKIDGGGVDGWQGTEAPGLF